MLMKSVPKFIFLRLGQLPRLIYLKLASLRQFYPMIMGKVLRSMNCMLGHTQLDILLQPYLVRLQFPIQILAKAGHLISDNMAEIS